MIACHPTSSIDAFTHINHNSPIQTQDPGRELHLYRPLHVRLGAGPRLHLRRTLRGAGRARQDRDGAAILECAGAVGVLLLPGPPHDHLDHPRLARWAALPLQVRHSWLSLDPDETHGTHSHATAISLHSSLVSIFNEFIGFSAVSGIAAVVFYFLVEAPFGEAERLLFKPAAEVATGAEADAALRKGASDGVVIVAVPMAPEAPKEVEAPATAAASTAGQ